MTIYEGYEFENRTMVKSPFNRIASGITWANWLEQANRIWSDEMEDRMECGDLVAARAIADLLKSHDTMRKEK